MIVTTTPIIDLGNVQRSTTVNFSFNITNNSTNIITLTTSATCGCTKPSLENNQMGPLEMQYATGTFKASSSIGAIYNKHISVTSNNGDTITIKLIGNVV
jgi:hypothetical protein